MNLWFFSDSCRENRSIATEAVPEKGTIPAGTKYVLVMGQGGADIDFTFSSVSTK